MHQIFENTKNNLDGSLSLDSDERHVPLFGNSGYAILGFIAFVWSIFQLWIASPFPFLFGFAIVSEIPARAIHLCFALVLCFLLVPCTSQSPSKIIPYYHLVLVILSICVTLYLFVFQGEITRRVGVLLSIEVAGNLIPVEAIIGGIGILTLLDATRRVIGFPLVIICCAFIVFSLFGQSMPDLIAHKGVSLERLIGYQWFTGEAIFGIPIDVSVSFVFLFVLFGALLEKAGAGKYFLDLAFSMVGQFRGGPAKAAIIASGMNGAISGSSVANVVTTGTFTIPVMRETGIPAVKAAAIEVAASTNGQIMPPIMGAAAFIMAETIGISYFEVVSAAFIPALISYLALLYISHLESVKLGLTGLPKHRLSQFWPTFIGGIHFLLPIAVLVWLLMVERWSAGSAIFYSIILLMIIIVFQRVFQKNKSTKICYRSAMLAGLSDVYGGLIAGARNMMRIAIAVAAAGIIVGSVAATGLNNAMVGVIEAASGGNVYLLLILTAILCVILGMGLPTTANYLVVASLLAGVLVELGAAAGLVLPLIAIHLFVFYFGLLADSTPPVCVAAFAASAISRSEPLLTGVQAFFYDIRTAILPFIFIFNTELLLIGVQSIWHGMTIFVVSLLAMLCFSSLTQWWLFVRLRWHEALCLFLAMVGLFRPDFVMDQIFPKFTPIEISQITSSNFIISKNKNIRLHMVRQTDYGDRFKLLVLKGEGKSGLKSLGIELGTPEGDRYPIVNVEFNSVADNKKIRPYSDFVISVDLSKSGQPKKEWVYLFALTFLGLSLVSQLLRKKLKAN